MGKQKKKLMKSEFRHSYLQYVGVYVGGWAIGIDYELTIYWGRVISVCHQGLVTIQYYAGEGIGHKTVELHPYRCIGDPYDEEMQPLNGHLQTRYSVLEHFHHYIIPKLKAFPEYYAEIQRINETRCPSVAVGR